MLSYLHSYHAGCRADVHKHQALAALLTHLTHKPKPLTYMETHAGRGLYDLAGPEAMKTGEAKDGIQRLLETRHASAEDPYFEVIQTVRERNGASFYPGSPSIAWHLLRNGDALHLMERHPSEHQALKRLMGGAGAHIHFRDGYEGVLGLSPPTPRRGLVLIDPSYEVKDEYADVAKFIPALHRKWAEAVVLLWYPILAEARHRPMMEALSAAGLPDTEIHEVPFPIAPGRPGMLGSGLFIVNQPYGFALRDMPSV